MGLTRVKNAQHIVDAQKKNAPFPSSSDSITLGGVREGAAKSSSCALVQDLLLLCPVSRLEVCEQRGHGSQAGDMNRCRDLVPGEDGGAWWLLPELVHPPADVDFKSFYTRCWPN